MKTKVGIVGPHDSVSLICKVAKNYEDLIPIPIIYSKVKEIITLIQNEKNEIDVWVFSGQVPFSFAKEAGLIKQNAFFPELNGSSLIRTMIEMVYKDQLKLERISFDTLVEPDIQETFSELQLPLNDIFINGYQGYKPLDKLFEFHSTLYRTKQVDACVTCLRKVYEDLKRNHIPAYRISPTKMAIRQVLDMAQQHGKTLHFQKAQIAVHIIQVDISKKSHDKKSSVYDDYRLKLKLQEIILEYAAEISGTLIPTGDYDFVIFSTRGSYEENIKYRLDLLLERISILAGVPVYIGIGYGSTALDAQHNARLGTSHAKSLGGNSIILVDQYGNVEGPLYQKSSLSFRVRSENKEMEEYLKKASVSTSAFNKLLSIQDKIGVINSANLAEWLGTTQRNARRILSNLEKNGLAENVGEESPSVKGRPRKNFRIKTFL